MKNGKKPARVESATVGTKYSLNGKEYTVKEPCQDQHSGFWCCLTCHESFENQFMKDVHIGKDIGKPHVLGWACYEHGLERP